ncbi:DNA (cytosine-5-)-methyltransferase [Cellulomonas iranensis]|uniref:DNA (cytosine-5-)-methyltransferase n=1 Tax=Cellulomonas iranensis TaxID=76862 RepID=UPI003D7ED5B3
MTGQFRFTYGDLFAGVGGFAAALSAFGGEHAYSVEIDRHAAAVYRRNWGHDPLGDITVDATEEAFEPRQWADVPREQRDERTIDVLAGGFPCQPFSKSGAQRGMDEIRGTLFFNIVEVIRHKRPTVVVLENVRNLAGPRHTHEWQVIVERLRAEGYQVADQPAIFSPSDIHPDFGGAPQVRDRVYITATRVPDGYVQDPHVKPIELLPETRMDREWDLALDLPLDDERHVPGTSLSDDEVRWINHWDEWVQVVREFRAGDADRAGEPVRLLPGFPVWAHVWVPMSQRGALLAPDGHLVPAWKQAFLHKNWALYDALRERGDADWLSRWLRKTRTFPESRQRLEWQAQDAESLWDCVISLRPSGLRAKRMTHLPALVAITQTPILGPLRRRLSPREAARLQGLPDEFDFGKQRDALTYKQMGNGVNTGVVWNVLKAHVERDKTLLLATPEGAAIYDAISSAPASPKALIGQMLGRARAKSDESLSATLSLV